MIRIPSAGTPISLVDILRALTARDIAPFKDALRDYLETRHIGLVNSGTTALYLILKTLKRRSDKREVILPAYTAPSLILPIRKAGLRPVVADISLETFNLDVARVADAMNSNTLAVIAVHMFGIPCYIGAIRAAASDAFVIDDAASSHGARFGGKQAGTLGDAGLISFNRGKNMSTVAGGAWITDDDELAQELRAETAALPLPGVATRMALAAKLIGLSLVARPVGYTLLRPLVSSFRYDAPHEDFDSFAYTALQAGAGKSLLNRIDDFTSERRMLAGMLTETLSGSPHITLPNVPLDAGPAYNQFPILLRDRSTRDAALRAALKSGVECTTLYDKPVRETYRLSNEECGGADTPNAAAMAERLLLIPCHPTVPPDRLMNVAALIHNCAES